MQMHAIAECWIQTWDPQFNSQLCYQFSQTPAVFITLYPTKVTDYFNTQLATALLSEQRHLIK